MGNLINIRCVITLLLKAHELVLQLKMYYDIKIKLYETHKI